MPPSPYSRREFLTGALGGAAALALGGAGIKRIGDVRLTGLDSVRAARQVKAAGSDIGAVEHVVFLMHENRSFDHYFGTLGSVNGFGASSSAFSQAWPGGTSSTLLPFHLDTVNSTPDAECTYDLSHTWQAQHASVNGGAMDSFVSTHTSKAYEGDRGVLTMGYYEDTDIPFYYALAEQFTICDAYFCSVLGPTHPNRLMQMTGWIDPAGKEGGPVLVTNSAVADEFTCSWKTMPEALSAKGVSWKVYNPYGSAYVPGSGYSMEVCKNVLMYFKQYEEKSSTLYKNAFGYYGPNVAGGLTSPNGPNDFLQDVKKNELPAVSWIIPPDGFDEHPPAPAALGEWYTQQILDILTSNSEVWSKTVLFIMYDENDGWFDHVPPPLAPEGTAGEFITATKLPFKESDGGVTGPIGMGVRVPMLVVSPFSAGGWVCSDTFDHTSQLRFLETRFGVTIPNLSAWRRANAGDLTSTLPTYSSPVTKVATLPKTSDNIDAAPIKGECTALQLIEINGDTTPYPVPTTQSQPTQGTQVLQPTPH